MSETAGWGAGAPWLPPAVRAAQLREDAAEARESRRAEGEAETRREAAHEQALAMYRAGAEARGEVVNAMDLAAGRVPGRPLADILAGAAALGDRQDALEEARRGRSDAEPLHIEFGDPVIHHPAARSEHAVAIRRISRRWNESRAANRAAAEKRRALDAELIPLQQTVQLNRPAPDPVAPGWEATRSLTGDVRYR
jgi:hypothetical protein